MSAPNEDNVSQPQLSAHVFDELLDSIIIDVASECHRIAKLGLDCYLEEEEELRLYAEARTRVADPGNSSETNGKYIVDIFGGGRPVLRQQEVALRRTSIHEEVLLQPTLLIQIPPGRVDYQREVPVFQVMNTRMAPYKSCDMTLEAIQEADSSSGEG